MDRAEIEQFMGTRLLDDGDRIIITRTDTMIREVIQKWHTPQGKDAAIRAAGALFVRMAGSWRSTCKLLDGCAGLHEIESFSNDAAAVVRCLHDASLQAEYILAGDSNRSLSPDDLGMLYLDFEIVERHRMMTKGVTFPSTLARHLAASPRRPAGEANLQRDFDRVKGAYLEGASPRTRPHWYKGNLPQIAERLGREEEHFWFLRSFDSSIHGGPLAVLKGPVPAGADLMILANHLICRTAKKLVSASGIELSGESQEVLDARTDDLLNIGPAPSSETERPEMTRGDEDERRFTEWLLSDVTGMTRELGYTPTRFIQMVHDHGGVRACKLLLRPEIPASIGFCRLHKLGRLDLSVEHIALSDEWGALFAEEEKTTARFRLDNPDEICSDATLVGE